MPERMQRIENPVNQQILHSMHEIKNVARPEVREGIVARAGEIVAFSQDMDLASGGDAAARDRVRAQRGVWNQEFVDTVGGGAANFKELEVILARVQQEYSRTHTFPAGGMTKDEYIKLRDYRKEIQAGMALAIQNGAKFGQADEFRDKSFWENDTVAADLERAVGVGRWAGGRGHEGEGVGRVCQYVVTSETIRKQLRLITRFNQAGILKMDKVEDIIAEIAKDQTIPDEEYTMAVAYLSDLRDTLAPKQAVKGEYPDTKEGQLSMARDLLNRIEIQGKSTRDYHLGGIAAQLENMAVSAEVDGEVAREIRARLKLIDCYVFMKKANGNIDTPQTPDPEVPNVGAAATLAKTSNHALDRDAIEFFLKTKNGVNANGIPVAGAWDNYQYINLRYEEVLGKIIADERSAAAREGRQPRREITGLIDNDFKDPKKEPPNYYTDGNPNRKKLVDAWVCERMASKRGVDLATANKAWELTQKLALATGETSVFNKAMVGNDQMAEDMYLAEYREGREKTGRPRGPQITLLDIQGIGNTWLRRVSNVNDCTAALYADDVKVEKINDGSNSYDYFWGVWWSGKIHPLRGELLNRSPDPKKMLSINFLQSAVDYFAKAAIGEDKEKEENEIYLRKVWVKGVLDMAASDEDLGWTSREWGKFRTILTEMALSEEKKTFLTKEQFDEVVKENNLESKMAKLERRRRTKELVQALLGGGGR